MSSLRHRGIKPLAHGYPANKWKSWDLNVGSQAIESTCCPLSLFLLFFSPFFLPPVFPFDVLLTLLTPHTVLEFREIFTYLLN